MKTNYSREIAIATLENYIEQIDKMDENGKNSYLKIYKSLKESINLLKPLGDMNEQETNEYFRLLMASISASLIIK